MALSSDGWVRRFLVNDAQRHRKGFTVYKVTSIVYPSTSPEATTKVVVWKRYNDFKKLHKDLQQRHQKLYLKDTFPPFSKANLFNRFEEEVVEERRLCALRLLEFAAEHPPLFTSQIFVKFFESGYTMGNTESTAHHETSNLPFIDDFGDDELLPEPTLRPITTAPRLISSDSLDPDPMFQESLFNTRESSDEDDGGHTSDSDSISISPKKTINDNVLQFFDPLIDDKQKQSSQDLLSESTNIQILQNLSINAKNDTVEHESCYGAGYIFEAACHVSKAQECEANSNYEEAFTNYKLGISTLLAGVQTDTDDNRRQIVKDKTAKYLVKAETIYNTFLINLSNNWVDNLIKPVTEIFNFKVLGILGQCMLVSDLTDIHQTCYVLKAMYKSPCPVKSSNEILIPRDISYSVPLIKYYETNNTIFILLLHISGGKLWDHLAAYINNTGACGFEFPSFLNQKNVYLGQKLLSDEEDLAQAAQELLPDTNDINMNSPIDDDNVQIDIEDNNVKISWVSHIDTNELVQNAQKLLKSVSATLQQSENVIARTEKPASIVHYISNQGAISKCPPEERRKSRSKSAVHNPRARLIERRYSCDDMLDGRSSLESGRRVANARERPKLPEQNVKIWAAQIVLALEGLHSCGLIYKDLNPDNILLGPGGSAILTFIGQWPNVDYIVNRNAVINLYAAPEISNIWPITPSADWWSLGAILYELIIGKTLISCHPGGIYSHTILYLPDWVSPEAKSFLTELLKPDPYERLGTGSNGLNNIKSHPFFAGINWNSIIKSSNDN